MAASDDRVLVEGRTCFRTAPAERFACIVDAAEYFYHCKAAMLRAQRRIVLVGWDFDTRMVFQPDGRTLPGPNRLGPLLNWLIRRRPHLRIYVLKASLGMIPGLQGIWKGMTPVALLNWTTSERLLFAVDGVHPAGAVHHQKIVVIDDHLAFCGGIDLTLDRWDTPQHLPDNTFRRNVDGVYGPRHEVAAAVDGAAALALAEVAADRWQVATRQSLPPLDDVEPIWPPDLEPTFRDVDVGVARTLPALNPSSEVREVEALNLAAIAAARTTIYLENQYLASRTLVDALADRLREAEGPEIVLVLPRNSESRLEQESMDSARHLLLQVLWDADEFDRFAAYWPVDGGGESVYVHAKVLVIDDRLLRIGSSNLNNRSMGFDTECDLAVEADPDTDKDKDFRRTVTAFRNTLVAEHLGVSADEVDQLVQRCDSLLRAVEALRGGDRTLRLFTEPTVADEASVLAENDLMDPDHVPRSFTKTVQRFIEGLAD